jgi:hypothetical protein
MIEKFNFYDVYGYFLPGFALLALIWAPFGIITHQWPSLALASAVAAIILAYIVGHLIQIIAHHALPSTAKDPSQNERYPSDLFLDDEDKTFSVGFKQSLAAVILKAFT